MKIFLKITICKHQSSNCCRQKSPVDAKISKQRYGEKQDICIVLVYSCTRYLLILTNYKGGKSNVPLEKPGKHLLSQVIKVNITSNELSDMMH